MTFWSEVTYPTSYLMPRVRTVRRVRTGRKIPRISSSDAAAVFLQKAGVDSVPRLLTACIVAPVVGLNSFTFAGSLDGIMTINVMN